MERMRANLTAICSLYTQLFHVSADDKLNHWKVITRKLHFFLATKDFVLYYSRMKPCINSGRIES